MKQFYVRVHKLEYVQPLLINIELSSYIFVPNIDALSEKFHVIIICISEICMFYFKATFAIRRKCEKMVRKMLTYILIKIV